MLYAENVTHMGLLLQGGQERSHWPKSEVKNTADMAAATHMSKLAVKCHMGSN